MPHHHGRGGKVKTYRPRDYENPALLEYANNVITNMTPDYIKSLTTLEIDDINYKFFAFQETRDYHRLIDQPSFDCNLSKIKQRQRDLFFKDQDASKTVHDATVPAESPMETSTPAETPTETPTPTEAQPLPPKKKKKKSTPSPPPEEITQKEAAEPITEPTIPVLPSPEKESPKPSPAPTIRKRIKVIIRGLDIDTDLQILKKEITDLNFEILHLTQLKKRREDGLWPLPLFLLNLPDDEHHSAIYGLNSILQTPIQVERFRGGRFQVQCYKCQTFGHTQRNCTLDPACMKCAGPHYSYQCTKPLEEPPTCYNCKEAHTSNFTGCKARPLRIRKPRRQAPAHAARLLSIIGELQILLKDQEVLKVITSLIDRERSPSPE